MVKFEILLTDEMIEEIKMAKDEHEKNHDGYYCSWEQFFRFCILTTTYQILGKGHKL